MGRVPEYDPLAPKGPILSALAWAGRQRPVTWFLVSIGSRGGHRDHPAWYFNVTATLEVELWTKGGGGRYRVKEAKGNQRKRLWNLATQFYPGFARYQDRAGNRRIPVIVCAPQDD